MVKRGTRTATKAREVTPSKEGRRDREASKQTNRKMGIGTYMRMAKDSNAKKIVTENKITPKKSSSTKDKKGKDVKIRTFDYGIEENEKNVAKPKDKTNKTEENNIKETALSNKEEEEQKTENPKETVKVESRNDKTNDNKEEKAVKKK